MSGKMLLLRLPAYTVYVFRRFVADRCLVGAASLSYTSLLALVPFVVIGLAVFSAFPVFEDVEEKMQDFIFQNLMPESIGAAQEYFNDFVDNASKLTIPGLVGLAVTAMMLLATIETAINNIFRVTRKRNPAARLTLYWTILTLAPLLFGLSFSMSSYIMSLTVFSDGSVFTGVMGRLFRMVPAAITMGSFVLFYMVIPNCRVRLSDAVVGGVVAGALFSGLRWGFGLYLVYVPTYQTIYGAMAVLPIFLVWMYLSWMVILFGGEVVVSIREFFSTDEGEKPDTPKPETVNV